MRLINSLTFRLTVLYAAFFSVSVMVILYAYYHLNVIIPTNSLKGQLRDEAAELSATYETGGIAELSGALWTRRHTEAKRYPFDTLIDARGAIVTGNLASWPASFSPGWLRIEADLHLEGQEEDREALVLDHRMDDGTRLLVGRNIEDLDDLEEKIEQAGAAFLPITAILAIVGGALISWSVGRRIAALDSAARRIMGSTLSERIPLAGKNDDIESLAVTLNRMLRRLEVALDGLRRTSDSVAHELRTPLARLRLHLEEMADNRSPSEVSLSEALKEVENLGSMFDAVLAITRLETGSGSVPLRNVDVSKILTDAAELYAGIAEDRNLRFDVDICANLPVFGNADLLFQAACNLLDNAMKYTPAGGSVSMQARATEHDILVLISDSGPGIPDELHCLVFQRFYRAPTASGVPGLGMGLAYVAAVNDVHQATIKLESRGSGLCVEWRIPRVPR